MMFITDTIVVFLVYNEFIILGGIKNNVIIQNSIFHHNNATKSGGAIGGVNAYIYLTGKL